MSEVLLPTWIVPEEETQEWLDEGSSVFGSAFAPGIAQRQSFGGLRLKLSRRHTVRGEEKAQLLSILNATRGRFNALRTKVHFALRGSGLGGEVLTNNTFANSATGWSANSRSSISVNDRVLRDTRNGIAGIAGFGTTSAVSVTQYAPHVLRAMYSSQFGPQDSLGLLLGTAVGNSDYLNQPFATLGLNSAAIVPYVSSLFASVYDLETSGTLAGNYFEVTYVSLAPCALADNSPNGFMQSDNFSDAVWVNNAGSVSGNVRPAPDGSTTADDFDENGASAEHYIEQAYVVPSAAADFCGVIDLRPTGRSFALISLIENTGATAAQVYVNMTDGSRSNQAVGANWANIRTFTVDRGDGWFRFYIVARKTNAATTIRLRVSSVAAIGGTTVITGLGASAFTLWRGGIAQSSVPFEPAQTTSAAATGTSQTGNALHLKGLPASTDGLLLPDDYFEINGEIKRATAALNSDAAQLGYLQFESALVRSPANDDPVIVTDPMGKFLVSNIKVQNKFGLEAVVTYDLEHIYE